MTRIPRSKVCHLLLFTYQNTITHFTDLSVGVPSQVPPPSDVHPRPSAEGEAGGRGETQFITQQPNRPKEGEEDFNNSLGLISLVGTVI